MKKTSTSEAYLDQFCLSYYDEKGKKSEETNLSFIFSILWAHFDSRQINYDIKLLKFHLHVTKICVKYTMKRNIYKEMLDILTIGRFKYFF